MGLEHFIVLESKEVTKDYWDHIKRHHEGAVIDQSWED